MITAEDIAAAIERDDTDALIALCDQVTREHPTWSEANAVWQLGCDLYDHLAHEEA